MDAPLFKTSRVIDNKLVFFINEHSALSGFLRPFEIDKFRSFLLRGRFLIWHMSIIHERRKSRRHDAVLNP
jgi:hypothetical protein